MMKLKKWTGLGVILVLILMMVLVGCSQPVPEEVEEPEPAPEEVEEPEPALEEVEEHPLTITGEVVADQVFGLETLQNMTEIQFEGTFFSLNSFGTEEHTNFKGIKLWPLLDEVVGLSEDSRYVTVVAEDGYQVTFMKEQIQRQDYIDETDPDVELSIIIAWEENGKAYDPNKGSPYKLVIGQSEPGDVNKPNWVAIIEKIVVE